jgi:hypothetical protein
MKTYKIKKEYLFKTVTIKSKSTAITYNLWNLNQRTAEYLFTHGYQHMFEQDELPKETIEVPEETIEIPEEKEFDLFVDKKKPCKTCGSQKTKRKYTKKI